MGEDRQCCREKTRTLSEKRFKRQDAQCCREQTRKRNGGTEGCETIPSITKKDAKAEKDCSTTSKKQTAQDQPRKAQECCRGATRPKKEDQDE